MVRRLCLCAYDNIMYTLKHYAYTFTFTYMQRAFSLHCRNYDVSPTKTIHSTRTKCVFRLTIIQQSTADHKRQAHINRNSVCSICCTTELYSTSTINKSTTNQQHLCILRCYGLAVQLLWLHNMSTTNRTKRNLG